MAAVVAEFRERQPDSPSALRGRGPGFNYGETGATCDICGYWGIIRASSRNLNAANDPDRILSCPDCLGQ